MFRGYYIQNDLLILYLKSSEIFLFFSGVAEKEYEKSRTFSQSPADHRGVTWFESTFNGKTRPGDL